MSFEHTPSGIATICRVLPIVSSVIMFIYVFLCKFTYISSNLWGVLLDWHNCLYIGDVIIGFMPICKILNSRCV